MAAPARDIYLAPDFDPQLLRVPQLRSILLEHGVRHPALAKKADLILLFSTHVVPRANQLLTVNTGVLPSARGIIAVSDDGTEALIEPEAPPAKRPRGRPRKTAPDVGADAATAATAMRTPRVSNVSQAETTASSDPATPPVPPKRGPGRPRKSAAPVPTIVPPPVSPPIPDVVAPVPIKRGPGRPRKSALPMLAAPLEPAKPAIKRGRKGLDKQSELDGASADDEDDDKADFDVNDIKPSPRKTPRVSHAHRSILDPSPQASIAHASTLLDSSPGPSGGPRIQIQVPQLDDELDAEMAAHKERRKARHSSAADESGYSDRNPFQSGSEEAAQRERRRRKSSIGLGEPKPTRKPRASDIAFAAQTKSTGSPATLRRLGPSTENLRSPPPDVRDALRREFDIDGAEERNIVISAKLNQISSRDVEPTVTVTENAVAPRASTSTALVRRPPLPTKSKSIPLALLSLLLLPLLGQYMSQSASIGYCDTHSATNELIVTRTAAVSAAHACVARAADQRLDHPDAPPIVCDTTDLPLIPGLPRPTACAPCPPHAICEGGEVIACEAEYLLQPHALESLGLGRLIDGLPGLGPRPLAPSCKPDTLRKRMIGQLAREIDRQLARRKGDALCASGTGNAAELPIEVAGVDMNDLRFEFLQRRDDQFSIEKFNDMFDAAVTDLLEHKDITGFTDEIHADLTFACRAKLEAVDLAKRWQSELAGTLAVIAAIASGMRIYKSAVEERAEADELTNVVLRRLQDQERLHYTDPVTTPAPFIAPTQMRDLVLPPSAAGKSRDRLWARVADAIQHNANVSVIEREVNGELWTTWEWTGVRRRVEF